MPLVSLSFLLPLPFCNLRMSLTLTNAVCNVKSSMLSFSQSLCLCLARLPFPHLRVIYSRHSHYYYFCVTTVSMGEKVKKSETGQFWTLKQRMPCLLYQTAPLFALFVLSVCVCSFGKGCFAPH